MEAEDYKCPSCSAPIKFNPTLGLWKCEYCKSEYQLEQLKENEQNFENLENEETMDVDEYTCSNCGAKIITEENTTATFCVYCRNTSIIKNRLTGVLKPKYVIPIKGEYRHLYEHKQLAYSVGYNENTCLMLDNGQIAEFNNGKLESTNEFIEVAKNEIYKSSELQHSISATLNNLLSQAELSSELELISKFFLFSSSCFFIQN